MPVMAAAWIWPTRIFRIIASSSPATPPGASVAILTPVGAGAAMPGDAAADAASSRTAAARLINEPFIHPPFQPACAALGHEIAYPMFRRPGARVEGERPVEEV